MRMGAIRNIVLTVALGATLVTPAWARQFTDDEKLGLADAIKHFDEAMGASDFAAVVGAIPPKVMQAMSDKYGVPVDELTKLVVQQTEETLKTVKVESYGMDLAKAEYKETADGTPYALVPTETVMDLGNGKVKATAATLAILDAEVFYLVRVSEAAQVEIFKSAYPSFADVVFPEGKMEPVQ